MGLGQVLYGLAMDMTYCRFAYKLGKQYTFSLIATLLLGSSFLFSIGIAIAAPQIIKITHHSSPIHYFYYMAIILTLDSLLALTYARIRVENKRKQLTLVKTFAALMHIIFSFILFCCPSILTTLSKAIDFWVKTPIALNKLDVVFIAHLLSNITTCALLLPYFKAIRLVWDGHMVKKIWHYASISFCSDLLFMLNRTLPTLLFLPLAPDSLYHSKEEIFASYGISWKLTLCIALAIQSFKEAAEPFFFSHATDKDAPNLYSQMMRLFIVLSCFIVLLFSLNINWISKIIIPNSRYLYTIAAAPYLAFIYVMTGIYYNLSTAFKLSHCTHYRIWIHLCSCITTGIMSWWSIPKWGYWGSIYATMSGTIVMVILGYGIGQICYPIPYRRKDLILLIVSYCLLTKIHSWPTQISLWGWGLGWVYLFLNAVILLLCLITVTFVIKGSIQKNVSIQPPT